MLSTIRMLRSLQPHCPEHGRPLHIALDILGQVEEAACTSDEPGIDPLKSPIVMGWLSGGLRPPSGDSRIAQRDAGDSVAGR
jgi:hypothetical protein